MYDDYLQGEEGRILTVTDVRGIEVENSAETRVDPVMGESLHLSLDYNIQSYVTQVAEKVMKQKEAKSVSVILMNPQNGEIYAMVNVPEFNLNEPFTLIESITDDGGVNTQDLLNQMCVMAALMIHMNPVPHLRSLRPHRLWKKSGNLK